MAEQPDGDRPSISADENQTNQTSSKKRGRPPKGWTSVFLRELARRPFVRLACKLARVSPDTVYRLRDKNPAFKAAWENALASAVEEFEASTLEWAMVGIEAPIVFKGEITATKLERSQYLAGMWLKALNPNRFADPTVNITSSNSPAEVAAAVCAALKEMSDRSGKLA